MGFHLSQLSTNGCLHELKAPSRTLTPSQRTSYSLPKTTGGFASNHIMVNITRERRGLRPLYRSKRLDGVAREHAEYMAKIGKAVHSATSTEELKEMLGTRFAGEIVLRGESMAEMHMFSVQQKSNRDIMMDSKFNMMGMATAKGSNGLVYLCQLYC